MKRLAIISTHPIQYYAPLFVVLAKSILLKVFYTWGEQSISKHDPGFNKTVEWDIPLLEGYEFEFITNTSRNPGSHHFRGIKNPNLIDKIADYKPDAILVFGWSYASHLKVMRNFKGKVPIWFRGDSTLLDESLSFRNLIKSPLLKWVYSHVDKAFYVGTANKKYFKKYGLNSQQLVFAPHAIDNNRFLLDHSEGAHAIRGALGIREDDILILFAGKFEEKKNPQILVSAFLELNHPKAHLLLVGNGPLEESLKAKTEISSSKIHFLDFQNQKIIPNIYTASDLFCLPSKGPGETWGLAVNEAMACGKAILVSDKVGCAEDLVHPGANGEIFKADSKRDLLEKMGALCYSNQLDTLGVNSKNMIKNWSYEAICDALITELNYEAKRQT